MRAYATIRPMAKVMDGKQVLRRLKKWRGELSIRAAAEAAGVSHETMRRALYGDPPAPRLLLLIGVERVDGLPVYIDIRRKGGAK